MDTQKINNNRPTLVEWFIKHNISSNICSTPHAIARAIDSLILEDEEITLSN